MSKREEGAKLAKAAQKEAAVARRAAGQWESSIFQASDLAALWADGFVAEDAVRIPGDEEVPAPHPDERVCFQSFVHHGFSLPVHPFVHGLLFTYQAQLHDLTPNGVLHIACFITLCECFLGVYPHWGLWRHLFNVKRSNAEYVVGGITISIKDKETYFDLEKLDSVQGWRKKWLYVKDQTAPGQTYGLAPFDPAARAVRQPTWEHELSAAELEVVEPMAQLVADLKEQMTGLQLIAVFVKRCVQPLQCRARPMWRYTRVGDSTRCLQEDCLSRELMSRVQRITKCSSAALEGPVIPYSAEHLPPHV